MKSFATLIKLQKNYVDEQRQLLARLIGRLEDIEGQIAQLEIALAREQSAAKDQAASFTYGAFLRSMVEKGRALEIERQGAEAAVKIAQDKLAELFEDQKRYETAEEQRIENERREEQRLETIELDEIGGVRHERHRDK